MSRTQNRCDQCAEPLHETEGGICNPCAFWNTRERLDEWWDEV